MSLKRVHFKWPLEELEEATTAAAGTTHNYDSVPVYRSRPPNQPSSSSKGVLGSRIRRFDPHKREDRSPEEDFLVTKSLCLPTPYDRTSPDDEHLTHSWAAGVPPSAAGHRNVRKYAAAKDLAPRRYPQTMSPKMEQSSEKLARTATAAAQSPAVVIKRPYVKDTSVIVRPRSLKHRHQREKEVESNRSLHRRDPTPTSTLKLRDVLDDDDEDDNFFDKKNRINEINCYGTPKFERRKKPSSAKKCATDPLLTDLIMASNSDRTFSSSNGARQSVPGGVEYTQISPRVIALTYPTNGSDAAYRHSIKEISEKLRRNYPDRYKIFNVSQKRSDLGRANAGAVVELGWPDQLAPPLDRLCSICKQIENWLNAAPDNLVVIHCKGWRSRAAIVVAAYMHYTNICAGDETVADRFSMQIFSEKFLGVDGQPSHKRYVRYFANLLSGKTKVNPTPIFLTSITLTKLAGKGIVVKIYERMKPVYSSQPVSTKSSVTIDVDQGLSLRGDVLVKCFEKRSSEERTLLFQCQFNTCALDLSASAPNVYFYKEELDLITDDRPIDSQAGIEFRFVFEAPKPTKRSRSAGARRSLSLSRDSKERDGGAEFSRADSYENFDRPEDDRSISSSIDPPYSTSTLPTSAAAAPTSPLYAELHKTPNGTTHPVPSSSSAQASPLDGADSGIGSDSPKHTMVPPQVPPKPQTPVFDAMDPDDPMRSAYEDSTIGRDRSVLPAAVRPPSRTGKSLASVGAQAASAAASANSAASPNDSNRPISPAESTATHRSTSRIEPDLVAKDRYDPSSKCFSYVPAKALKEHYTAPKKPPPSLRRPSMERSNLDIPSVVDHDSLRQISITPSELTRRAETPTWDSVVDKIAPKVELPEVRKHYSEIERERYGNGGNDYFSKTLPNGYGSGRGYGDDEEYEKPVVVNQARQAAPTPTLSRRSEGPPRRRRFDSNEDYNSDMDDFCDPEFYLSYASAPPVKAPPVDRYGAGSKSVELPRKPVKAISQRELDEIDSIIESTAALPPRACMTPKPTPPSERDAFRLRNCRSVTSAPRKLFSNDRYDATTDADNPDDWLKNKLRTLHSKRSGRPDVIARKNTERILLEELKNANTERAPQRDEYVAEGYGQRPSSTTPAVSGSDAFSSDPLEEYQREEARLHNTRSPFTAIDDFRAANRAAAGTPNSLASSTSRFTRGATPTLQAMRAKPPTPPPREVRSPPPSQSGRRSATTTPSAYQQERARLASNNDYLSDDEDDAGSEFSHQMRSLVQDAPVTKHEPTTGYGTATKSILKRRSGNYDDNTYDSKSDIYASPRSYDTDSRAGGSSHYAAGGSASSTPLPSGNRAETPAFPVTTRETPLPFHPLLYQGAASGSNGSQQLNNAITTRSGSPRSMYYGQQSRRSSMTSIEGGDVIHHHPVFVKDTSKYWYKPTISREDAISMLREKPPGTFVVRDSNSFPGAFGLALKVAKPPEGVPLGDGNELVRHFLIEPSPKGVKLKGCNNEPVFGTLAALVYQHSITPMALPCRLLLPEYDPASTPEHLSAAQALLEQGAACNVTYIYSFDTESLTGPEAVRRAVAESFVQFNRGTVRAVNVHFKVSAQGITLTDNTRTLFFRRHYPVNSVIFAGIDPEDRKWDNNSVGQLPPTYVRQARIFGFVARKISSRADNACHVFAELDPEQPASAVVNFITKVMMGQNQANRARTPIA